MRCLALNIATDAHTHAEMSGDLRTYSEGRRIPDISEELLARCRSGEIPAFEQLYKLCGSYMYSLALRFHGNPFDAEDSVQDAFVAVYKGIAGFAGQSRFSTWLYRVLLNACISSRRKKREMEESSDFLSENLHPRGDPKGGDAVLKDILEREISGLQGLQRAVFLLCACEGFTHQEVAETLGIRVGTSKSAYHRARKALGKKLVKLGIDTSGADR